MAVKESYKIIFSEDCGKNKAGTKITGLTFEQQMDFMMDNFEFKGKFKIESEQPKITTKAAGEIVKKSDKELFEDAKEIFLDSLTASEIGALRDNKKRICHNEQIGFYLRLVSSKPETDEIHISIENIRGKEKRNVYQSLKAILLANYEGKIFYQNNLFEDSDIKDMIEDLFKGRC